MSPPQNGRSKKCLLRRGRRVSVLRINVLGVPWRAVGSGGRRCRFFGYSLPIGSMYAIYGNIYHQYTPNVSIYTIHGSDGLSTNI